MRFLKNTFTVHGAAQPLRRLLLVGVFCLCGVAFWMHFERRFAAIEAQVALMDEPEMLSQDDRRRLLDQRDLFRKAFGINVRVQVCKTTVLIPELSGNTVFVGLTPDGRQTVVVFPSLVRRALPEGFKRQVEQRLELCAATPGPCVATVLDELFNALEQ